MPRLLLCGAGSLNPNGATVSPPSPGFKFPLMSRLTEFTRRKINMTVHPADLEARRQALAEKEPALRARDRKSTRLNSSHYCAYRMPSSACKTQNTNNTILTTQSQQDTQHH